MGTYVKRSCPKCKNVLEGYTLRYYAIGRPFECCKTCGTYVLLDHITEWDLKAPFSKVGYIFRIVYTAFIYGMSLSIAYMFYATGKDFNGEIFAISIGVGFVVSVSWRIYANLKVIGESRERLKNPEYRNLLRSFGLLK